MCPWTPQAPEQEPLAPVRLEAIVIEGREEGPPGLDDSAAAGRIEGLELEERPLLRPGAVLEAVPGVIVTQHSGAGKANQFFLRGFNLDHGTDLLTSVERVPINLPSHGHGQGYTDLNFVLPELIESVEFRKGPYFADAGDFASAGSVELRYVDRLERGLARVTLGEQDYARILAADSLELGGGDLLYAFEGFHDDGPWTNPDDYGRFNGLLKWSREGSTSGGSLTLSGMDGEWNATDQIPERAVDSGLIGRFDAIDPSDGGETTRVSLVGEWHARDASSSSEVTAYATRYELDLWSNFTYFLDDPINGDQFQQTDRRTVLGLDARHSWDSSWGAREVTHSAGLQLRNDAIHNGLFSTRARTKLSTTREDDIDEPSAGLWYQNELRWTDSVRSLIGVRGDAFHFEVDSDDPDNSGSEDAAIASAKGSLVFGPWNETELFLNAGQGFHSNDARGVFTTDDPSTPAPNDASPVDPLVRTHGAEIGLRTNAIESLRTTLSVWLLDSDSEILFVGDAGSTTASRPSRRYGVELASRWTPSERWNADLELSWSHARFRDDDPAGDHVPGAIGTVASGGLTWTPRENVFATLRGRYFGPRDLVEDGSVESSSSTSFDLAAGWRFAHGWSLDVGLFNLFDDEASDIEYFYASRLPGEAAGGVDDVHFHPAEGRTLRVGVGASW